MVRVKICGNRRVEDALLAVKYGADAIGVLVGRVHNSPDFISEPEAFEIIKKLPPFVSSVLVTHLVRPEDIIPLAERLGVTTIQLHGETTPEQAILIRQELSALKLCKAVHVTGPEAVDKAKSYENAVDAILLDTIKLESDQVGGTGDMHDWAISKRVVAEIKLPVILAGGLRPDNVQTAIREVNPYGVDVNSGTKGPDGYKDQAKLKSFIVNAKCV